PPAHMPHQRQLRLVRHPPQPLIWTRRPLRDLIRHQRIRIQREEVSHRAVHLQEPLFLANPPDPRIITKITLILVLWVATHFSPPHLLSPQQSTSDDPQEEEEDEHITRLRQPLQ
ncbi:MAG: hypothetical protein MJE68_20935, partial [Proteobacteria bacterium]|nr:hypothetical protein [Pseudomonadota bacterium]